MNKAVALVLNKVLGDWLEGIDSNSLNLSLLSGSVRLGPIQVKPDAINSLGFPFTLRVGFVNQINVSIPVMSIGSKAMVIDIDGLYVFASPKTKDEWNPETEINNQKKAKKSQLDNFEVMSKEEMPSDPGFAGRLVGKIIDNVQININGVYFRYEDAVTMKDPFALGIVLKKLEVFTCNDAWEREFREDAKVNNRKINIEGFSMFLDYGSAKQVSLKQIKGLSEPQIFEQYGKVETDPNTHTEHKYIIHPLYLSIKFSQSKDPTNKSIPQIAADISLGKPDFPFKFAFEAPQATYLMRTGNYFSEFKTFQTGVFSQHIEGPFSEEEGQYYRDLYGRWRGFMLQNNKKKADSLNAELESYENLHTFEDIAKQRQVVVQTMSLDEEEKELHEQLKKLEGPVKQGKMSKMASFVGWGPSKDDLQDQEQERKRLREEVDEKLRAARAKKAKFEEEVSTFISSEGPVFDPGDKNYNRMVVKMTIFGYVFDIGGENRVFMHMEMKKLELNTTMRLTTMDVDLNIDTFEIIDCFATENSKFPKIIETGGLQLSLRQPVDQVGRLKVVTQQLRAIANIECLIGLAGEMSKAMSGLVDVEKISKEAGSRSDYYVKAGKKYMGKTLSGKYDRKPMELDLQLAAPCFIIPYTLTEYKDFLLIDLGTISASTQIAPIPSEPVDYNTIQDKSALYDRYLFELQGVAICTVKQCQSIENWKEGDWSAVFMPEKVSVDAGVCVTPKHPDFPALEVYVRGGKAPIYFSDQQMFMLLKIKDKMMSELAKNMPEKPAPPPKKEEIQAEVPTLTSQPSQSFDPTDVVCQRFYIYMEEFSIDLIAKEIQIFNFTMKQSLLVTTIASNGNIAVDYRLKDIFADDVREGVKWPRMLGDPNIAGSDVVPILENAEMMFLEHIPQEKIRVSHCRESEEVKMMEADFGIRVVLVGGGREIVGGCRLGDMCVTINPDSLQALQSLPNEAFRLLSEHKAQLAALQPSTPSPLPMRSLLANKVTKTVNTTAHTVVSTDFSSLKVDFWLILDNMELRIPLDSRDENCKVFCMYMETDVKYKSNEEYEYGKNNAGKVIDTRPVFIDKDARVDIFKLGMIIGYERDGRIQRSNSEKGDFVQPCRLNLGYSQFLTKEGKIKNIVDLNLETFEISVGFRDIAFFKELGQKWAKPPAEAVTTDAKPTPKVVIPAAPSPAVAVSTYPPTVFCLDFKLECVQFSLSDDTKKVAIPLIKSQLGNFSAQVASAVDEFTMSVSGSTETSYYNSLVASWEPLTEFWTFELVASPKEIVPIKKSSTNPSERKQFLEFVGVKPLNIQFKALTPFRVNVTYSMVRTLSVMMKTLAEDARVWEAEKLSGDISTSLADNSKVTYKLKNRTGHKMRVKIEGEEMENGEFELELRGRREVTQTCFEKAMGRNASTKKYSSMLQTPQTPSTVTLQLDEGTKVTNVAVDQLGLYAYPSVTEEGSFIIVEITAKTSHISVYIQSGFTVVNNTELTIELVLGTDRLEIKPGDGETVPLIWTKQLKNIKVQTSTGEQSIWEDSLMLQDQVYVVLDTVELVTNLPSHPQKVLLFNPPLRVQNFLPNLLHLQINSAEGETHTTEPGHEISVFNINPKTENKFMWELELGGELGKLRTEFVDIEKDEEHFKLTGDIPADKLSFTHKSKSKYNKSQYLDLNFRVTNEENFHGRLISVYNQYWIVNHTDFTFDFTGKKGYLHILPHSLGMVKCKQNSLTARLAQESFGPQGEPSTFSQKFNITTTGVAGLVKLENTENMVKLGHPMEVSVGLMISAGPFPIIKSTVIHLYPRYIVTNFTQKTLYFRQQNDPRVMELAPKAPLCYQFPNSKIPKNVQISSDQVNWSSAFTIDEIEDFQVRSLTEEKLWLSEGKWWQPTPANGHFTYTRVVVATETEATLFVNLLQPIDAEMIIKNESDEEIRVNQTETEVVTTIPPRTVMPFAYDDRLKPVKKVLFRSNSSEQTYVLDKIKDVMKPLGSLLVTTEADMSSRVITIRSDVDVTETEIGKQLKADPGMFSNLNINFSLAGFELSLHDEVPKERFLMSVAELRLKIKQRIGDGPLDQRFTQHSINLRIRHVQLDNMQIGSSEFPIIFGGTDPLAAVPPLDSSIPITPFFQVGIVKDHIDTYRRNRLTGEKTLSAAFDRFVYLNVTIQEMQVRVHQDTVTGLMAVVAKLQSGFSKEGVLTHKRSYTDFTIQSACPMLRTETPTLSYDPGTIASKVYLHMVQMNALKIVLSFKTGRKQELNLDPRKGFGVLGLLGRIGGAFITITDSTLHFSSVIICDSFHTMSGMVGLIVKNYVKQGILQFYKIIGSSDLLGNPIGLIDKLGTGVFEFFSEPVKGLMKASPSEFSKGVGKGVRSLVGGVVSGSFGSVSKITGSLYTIVREVGGDEESANRINQTDNVAEGVFHGVKGGIVDLAEGVTGVFTKPWQGAKKGGVKGFFKGVSSGVVGAVTAPLSAVLRVSTSVTSSVVMQASLLDDKIKQAGRMRFPRQFGARKVLEAYNHALAQAQHVLSSKKEHEGEDILYYMRTGPREHVLLTQKHMLYIQRTEVTDVVRLTSLHSAKVKKAREMFKLVVVSDGEVAVIRCDSFQKLAKLFYAIEGVQKIFNRDRTRLQ